MRSLRAVALLFIVWSPVTAEPNSAAISTGKSGALSCQRCQQCKCQETSTSSSQALVTILPSSSPAVTYTGPPTLPCPPQVTEPSKREFELTIDKVGKLRLVGFPLAVCVLVLVIVILLLGWIASRAKERKPGQAGLAAFALALAVAYGAYRIGWANGHDSVIKGAGMTPQQMTQALRDIFDGEMAKFQMESQHRRDLELAETNRHLDQRTNPLLWPFVTIVLILVAFQALTLGYLLGQPWRRIRAIETRQAMSPSTPQSSQDTPKSGA